MNPDLILKVALKVGLTFELPANKLVEFANVIQAIEREECAKIADKVLVERNPWGAARWIAQTIRARGQE